MLKSRYDGTSPAGRQHKRRVTLDVGLSLPGLLCRASVGATPRGAAYLTVGLARLQKVNIKRAPLSKGYVITNQVRMDVLVSDLGRFGPLQRGRGGVYGSRRGARLEIEVASP